jgi:hypothetical protein
MRNILWAAITFTVVAPATFTSGFLLGINWPQNDRVAATSYEECVLSEMRGQAKTLAGEARRLCRNRFPSPFVQQKPLDFSAQGDLADAINPVFPQPKPPPDPYETLREGAVVDEESPGQ